MNKVEYKKYDSSYEEEVLKVFVESFVNYPLFWGVFEDRFKSDEKLRSFHERLMKGIFKATIRKDECYIGCLDRKVVSIVIIEKPSDKPVGFWDYAVSGMAGIIARVGIKDTLEFMDMSDKTEIVVKKISDPRWHLYFLSVAPEYQNQGIGSSAIQDFLIPMVKENGGNLITVTTNAKKNVEFYTKNGFSLVKEETLECKGKSVGNWTFRMDI
ncbi:GNAT family N-acetyltransferase [Eubacterium xylanophilum]|uniref:GNAT family N-acetyltransferase n=1 Tax=Eubacterium xylanophilum TaxID=39497 RepID=UPI00047B11CE|nr:GNAT family N-acetyltransferase [Eubacterium xylanophilum]